MIDSPGSRRSQKALGSARNEVEPELATINEGSRSGFFATAGQSRESSEPRAGAFIRFRVVASASLCVKKRNPFFASDKAEHHAEP